MSESETELPRALIKRIVKDKLSKLEGSEDGKRDYQLSKDALLAFSESTKVFITYLASVANDICKESKRQTISPADVLQALEEVDFPEFVEPLKEHLEVCQAAAKEQRARKKSEQLQRKKEKPEELAGVKEGGHAEDKEDAEMEHVGNEHAHLEEGEPLEAQ